MALGDKIKTLRNKLGLSQQQLANLTGITQATISRIECGDVRQPQPDYLSRIAWALQVSMDELLELPNPRIDQRSVESDSRARYIFRGYERLDELGKKKLLEFVKQLERQQQK